MPARKQPAPKPIPTVVDLDRVHPAAALLPPMSDAEYEQLVVNVKLNGLLEAIVLDQEGQILDGRNRARACSELGIPPTTTNYEGDNPIAYVISRNLTRRMLQPSQLACIGLAALDQMRARGPRGPRAGRGRDEAALLVGASGRSIQRAQAVRDRDGNLFDRVRMGELNLRQAERELKRRDTTATGTDAPTATTAPSIVAEEAEPGAADTKEVAATPTRQRRPDNGAPSDQPQEPNDPLPDVEYDDEPLVIRDVVSGWVETHAHAVESALGRPLLVALKPLIDLAVDDPGLQAVVEDLKLRVPAAVVAWFVTVLPTHHLGEPEEIWLTVTDSTAVEARPALDTGDDHEQGR